MNNYDDSLYHYGVKGMRWGFRKDESISGRVSKIKKKVRSYKNSRAIASGKTSKVMKRFKKMSNEELEMAIARINYRQILSSSVSGAKNSDSSTKGKELADRLKKKFEDETINTIATSSANLIGSYMTGAINGSVAGIGAKGGIQKTAVNSFKKKK